MRKEQERIWEILCRFHQYAAKREEVFLDDLTVQDVEAALGMTVKAVESGGKDFLDAARIWIIIQNETMRILYTLKHTTERMSNLKFSKQMSESIKLGVILAIAGGFMDAYSYMCRGKVFANAQTGNILLLESIFQRETGIWHSTIWFRCWHLPWNRPCGSGENTDEKFDTSALETDFSIL